MSLPCSIVFYGSPDPCGHGLKGHEGQVCTLSLPSKQTRRARQGTCSRGLTTVSGGEPKALDSSECLVHLQVWLLGLAFKALPCPLTSSLPTHQDSVLRSLGHIDQTAVQVLQSGLPPSAWPCAPHQAPQGRLPLSPTLATP